MNHAYNLECSPFPPRLPSRIKHVLWYKTVSFPRDGIEPVNNTASKDYTRLPGVEYVHLCVQATGDLDVQEWHACFSNHSISINMDTEWYIVCLKVSLIFAPWWGWVYLKDGHVQLSGKMVGSEEVRAGGKIGSDFASSKFCKSGSQFEACTMTEVVYSYLSSGPSSSRYTRKIHSVHYSKRSTHEVLLAQILNLGLYRFFFFYFFSHSSYHSRSLTQKERSLIY